MGLTFDEPLELPPRIQNALEEHGIFTWGDLFHCSLVDLRTVLRIPRQKKPVDLWDARRFGDDGFADSFER